MSTEENKDTVSESKKENSAQAFDIKEFLGRAWDAKYWIILSILVCCGYMYYRYKREAPVYTSNAELMFLFPNSGSSQGSATLAALRDLGTTTMPGDINMFNEMEIFHSPTLMTTGPALLFASGDCGGVGKGISSSLPLTFTQQMSGRASSLVLLPSGLAHLCPWSALLCCSGEVY